MTLENTDGYSQSTIKYRKKKASSFKKMQLKLSSAKWWFFPGGESKVSSDCIPLHNDHIILFKNP